MSDKLTESILWAKGYRTNGKGEWFLPLKDNSLLQAAERKPDTSDESVAKNKGEDHRPGFRFVRITSLRMRLLDERNLYDKAIVDSLVYAGVLADDSPSCCRVEVYQRLVYNKADECTEIEVIGEADS